MVRLYAKYWLINKDNFNVLHNQCETMIHVSVTPLTHLFFVVGADEREIEHDKDNGAIVSKGHRNGQ